MLIKEPDSVPNEVKANRKLALEKCGNRNALAPYYNGNTRRKTHRYASENGMTKLMYISRNIPGVNPVMMNYRIRHNKNWPGMRPASYSLVWPYRLFRYYLSQLWQKNGKHVWTWEATCKDSHRGRLAQYVS